MQDTLYIKTAITNAKRTLCGRQLTDVGILAMGDFLDARAAGLIKGEPYLEGKLVQRFLAEAMGAALLIGVPKWQRLVSRSFRLTELWGLVLDEQASNSCRVRQLPVSGHLA